MELKLAKRRDDWWVRALCEWARDNEPLLTFRSEEEIEKIVRAARIEKAGLLAAISIPLVLVSVVLTWRVTDEIFGPSPNQWQAVAAAALVGGAMAPIVRFISDTIMRREISRLARGTYERLSHE